MQRVGWPRSMWLGTLWLVVGMAAIPSLAQDRIVVVVSSEWTALDSVSIPLLRQLYMGRRSGLAGERVACFDLSPGSRIRQGFIRSVFRMSERDLQRYWIEQALTGGDLPPREVGSVDDLVRAVGARKGAIGYLDLQTFQALDPAALRVVALEVNGVAVPPEGARYPLRFSRRRSAPPPGTKGGNTPPRGP